MSDRPADPRAALARLIAAERGVTAPGTRRAANWAALERAIAAPAAPPAAPMMGKLAAPAALTGALAAGLALAAVWPVDVAPEDRAPVALIAAGPGCAAASEEALAPGADATETETIASPATAVEPPPSFGEPAEDPLQTIRQAYLELRARRPAAALAASERYIRRWPQGMMIEEAEAARVLALCALGRRDAAARAKQRFLERWPRSFHGERMRGGCEVVKDRPGPRTQDREE